jgi:hypothetical protein
MKRAWEILFAFCCMASAFWPFAYGITYLGNGDPGIGNMRFFLAAIIVSLIGYIGAGIGCAVYLKHAPHIAQIGLSILGVAWVLPWVIFMYLVIADALHLRY